MRLKYAPYYHAMEAQTGTNIRLDGHDMIMLSSNDYPGLSFHPKVIEAGRAAMLNLTFKTWSNYARELTSWMQSLPSR